MLSIPIIDPATEAITAIFQDTIWLHLEKLSILKTGEALASHTPSPSTVKFRSPTVSTSVASSAWSESLIFDAITYEPSKMPPQQTYEPNHAEILVKRENELTLLETRAQIIDDRIWELVSAENPRVTEFLWARIMRTETRLAYLRSYADCLEEMKAAGITGHETFIIETQAVARTTRKRAQELRLLTRHGPAIIGEMEMEIERLKTRPLELVNNSEIRTTLLGCAYGNVLERLKVTSDLERINDPQVSNERKLLFQKAVSEYYNAVSMSGDYIWCHVLGRWVVSRKATAAQFVPGSVSREDLAYLFGEEGLNTCDARNGTPSAPAPAEHEG